MKLTTWMYRGALGLLLGTLLTACGFHLRGASDVAFDTVYVEGVQRGPTLRALTARLQARGVNVVDATALDTLPPDAIVVRVLADQHERVVTATTVGAQVREITLKVRFNWQRYDGQRRVVGVPAAVAVEQAMSYSESQDLAKQSEEARVLADLQSQAVTRVIRQLSSKAP